MFVATFVIVYALTKNAKVASAAGCLDLVAKTLLYFLHECLWQNVWKGKRK